VPPLKSTPKFKPFENIKMKEKKTREADTKIKNFLYFKKSKLVI
jgi:hypothetical protein